jgi:hypothetical protein
MTFDVHSFPVCSPAYLKQAPPLENATDLLDHNLIQAVWVVSPTSRKSSPEVKAFIE